MNKTAYKEPCRYREPLKQVNGDIMLCTWYRTNNIFCPPTKVRIEPTTSDNCSMCTVIK